MLGGARGINVATLEPVAEDEKSWEVEEDARSWEVEEDERSWEVEEADVASDISVLLEADDGFDAEIMIGILTLVEV